MVWPFTKREQGSGGAVRVNLWPLDLWRPKGDRSLEGSEAIFGATTLLANAIASMKIELKQGPRVAAEHPMHRLISSQPNPRMDAFQWRQTMESCRDTDGNCYAFKVRSGMGEVIALDVLDPARVSPQINRDTGDIWYVVRPDEGGEWYVSGHEMIHCRHVCTSGGKGVSPIAVLADTLDYDDQMKTFSLEQVKGINGAVVLEYPNSMGREQIRDNIDAFMEHYKRSMSSIIMLQGGVKASTIAKSPVDAKVLDVDRITANKVARVYTIPPSMLGDYSTVKYNSQTQQQLEFLDRTIVPIVRMYEAQLNLKLLTPEERAAGYRFVFDLSDLLAADPQAQAEVQQSQVRSGVKTPNEIRERNGDPPRPGGDTLMISRDLVPLDWLVKNPDRRGGEVA